MRGCPSKDVKRRSKDERRPDVLRLLAGAVMWLVMPLFIAAQVGSGPAELDRDLRNRSARVDAVRSRFESQVVVRWTVRLAFLWRAGAVEYAEVDLKAVPFEPGGSAQFLDRLVSTYMAIGIDPLDETRLGIATISVVVESRVGSRRSGFHGVTTSAHEEVVSEVPVLPDRRRRETLPSTADRIVEG